MTTRLAFFGGLAALLALYAHFVLQGLTGPLVGIADTEGVEHTGFLFRKMMTYLPYPRLFFETDWIAYPQGINGVFQAWFLEREYLSSWFGPGGWLKWYALASPAIAAVGSFFLLRGRHGERRAALVGLAAAFLGFYAAHKYPEHFNLTLCHWMILNLVADFTLCRIVVDGDVPSLSRVLTRVVLLILALSQDLSYVAGYALASFTLTSIFLFFELRRHPRALLSVWREEANRRTGRLGGQLFLIVVLGWLFVPLCFQIFAEARRHSIPGGSVFWANPLRLLIPWLPFLNPGSVRFHDSAEGFGAASPGWALLVAGLVGAGAAWRARDRAYVPLAALLLLAILNHPQNLPLMKVFPWFGYARVTSRYTLILPVALCLFALAHQWKRGLVVLAALAAVEAYTAVVLLARPILAPAPAAYFDYHEKLRAVPGDALLDWPFCALAGNGITERLCPEPKVIGRHSTQRFHGKKVVGFNLGRLTPEIAWPLLRVGWHHVHACPQGDDWRFIDDFVKLNPLAGIQLHLDALPSGCREAFEKRYGAVVATTELPGGGRVAFIEKPAAWRAAEDRGAGRRLRYEPPLQGTLELVASEAPYGTTRDGFGFQGSALTAKRRVSLRFFLDSARDVKVWHRWESIFPDQIGELWFNGRKITSLLKESETSLKGIPGENRIEWEFAKGGSLFDLLQLYREAHGPLSPLFHLSDFTTFDRKNRNEAARFTELKIQIP